MHLLEGCFPLEFKGIIPPHIVPNLYCCYFLWKHNFLKILWMDFFPYNRSSLCDAPKRKKIIISCHVLLCYTKQITAYSFKIAWGWVTNDRMLIFRWTVPLNAFFILILSVWIQMTRRRQPAMTLMLKLMILLRVRWMDSCCPQPINKRLHP